MGPEQSNGVWRAIWAEYSPRLLLFARQQTPALSEAEDIVQEAFIRYWKAREKEPDLPQTLLFTMVKRIATDQARKLESRRLREAEAQALEASEAFFAPTVEERERQEFIEASLRALPGEQREVLVLKIWGGLTFEEIGRTLEISPNTAASRYRYGLTQLKTLLTPALP